MNSRRRASALVGLAAAVVLMATPGPTGAMPGGNTDPDDVSLKLDLKSISHTNDAATVTYVAETYDNFSDKLADFKWGIDKNGDESFDLIVFTEWGGTKLIAEVDDGAENEVAKATVTRLTPNSIQVSFPVGVLGGAMSYRYGVSAEEDLNGNGESDPGEQDLAPDVGLYDHSLSSAPGGVPTGRGAPVAAPAPVTAPAPAPATRPSPTPAPAPGAVAVPETPRTPTAASPATPATTPAVVPGPATPMSPKAAAGSLAQEIKGQETTPSVSVPAAPAPAEAPGTLARTGSADGLLALFAGLALVAAGFMFFAETLVPTAKPRA